jgi:hypothetical protein
VAIQSLAAAGHALPPTTCSVTTLLASFSHSSPAAPVEVRR